MQIMFTSISVSQMLSLVVICSFLVWLGVFFKWKKGIIIIVVMIVVFLFPKESIDVGNAVNYPNKVCKCLGILETEDDYPFMDQRSCYGIPYACSVKKLDY